jgi:hypothetical protein
MIDQADHVMKEGPVAGASSKSNEASNTAHTSEGPTCVRQLGLQERRSRQTGYRPSGATTSRKRREQLLSLGIFEATGAFNKPMQYAYIRSERPLLCALGLAFA